MQLLDWLESVVALQANPGDVVESAIESAIDHLRQRAQDTRSSLADQFDRPHTPSLWKMTDYLLDITGDREDFLDTGDFRTVRAARLRALRMMEIEEKLYEDSLVL